MLSFDQELRVLQKDLSFNCWFKAFNIHKQLGTIIRCFVAQLKFYTVEYFGILIYTTGVAQALQTSVEMDFFITILKFAFQTRFKIIPVNFTKGIWLTSNLLSLPNNLPTSE